MGCLRARMLQRCNHTRVTRVTGMAQHASSRSCLSREARRVEASQRHYDQRALQHPGVFCNTRLDSRYAVRLLIGVSKTAFRARVNTAVRTSPGDSGSLVHVKTLEYYNIYIYFLFINPSCCARWFVGGYCSFVNREIRENSEVKSKPIPLLKSSLTIYLFITRSWLQHESALHP